MDSSKLLFIWYGFQLLSGIVESGPDFVEQPTGCWESNLIPYYVFRSFSMISLVESFERQYLRDRITKMNRQLGGCLRWVNKEEVLKNATHYVMFQFATKGGCRTYEKTLSNGERVTNIMLTKECFEEKTIMHQMMHALGFHHEHQRSDRDCYVYVDPSISRERNYVKLSRFIQPTVERFPYDKMSVMHFPRSQNLMAVVDFNIFGQEVTSSNAPLGNTQETLTDLDIWKIQHKFCRRRHYCVVHPDECNTFKEYEKKHCAD